MTEYVVWDWNGTLFDDLEVCFDCLNIMLARHGRAPVKSIAEYRRIFRFPIRDYYIAAGFDFSQVPYETLAAEYMELYTPMSRACRMTQGARETVEELRRHGIRQVVLSASRMDYLTGQINAVGATPLFDEVLGIGDIYGHSKTETAASLAARRVCEPAHMLYVGDSLHDAETARVLGCRCLLYSGGHQALPPSPEYVIIDSISETTRFALAH